MEEKYDKINTTDRKIIEFDKQKDGEIYDPITVCDVKAESAIFEIVKVKEYSEIIKSILTSIDNYNQDIDTIDDYPYFRVQNMCKFIPKLNVVSEIFSERQLRELHANLPYYHQYKNLKLLYSSAKHGIAMKTFYMKTEDYKNTIIVIKDDDQNVFGSFVSESFKNKDNNFYGTGETFLFTFYKGERVHIYQSTGINEYYIYSDLNMICFGCSDSVFSLCIKDEFLKGYSKFTTTFKNPSLNNRESFYVLKIEVWTFDEN